jgi:ADP-dependent NAD(P)H-hydrate dehydratase / NAD(P)H-hydrate epimerase
MKIVTAGEMRAIDKATSERFGVPSHTLMENAGTAVAEHVLSHYAVARKIIVICGKGNTGGDGFVAARKLHEAGKPVQVILLADPAELKGDAAAMFGRLPVKAVAVRSSEDLKRAWNSLAAGLFVDAILGTGFKPPVSSLYTDAIALMNANPVPVVAVDIPSGADADAMDHQQGIIARADSVVTFTAPRPAHVFSSLTSGSTVVAPIGSPDEAIVSSLQLNVITPQDFGLLLAPRVADSNKGLYGHVLVIGGSLGKAGAAAMAGMAVLRAGAGLCTVAAPKSVLATVAGFHPELMTEPLRETAAGTISTTAKKRIAELAKGKTVLAIGPGISQFPETSRLVRSLTANRDLPVVLDADGLNAFENRADELNKSRKPKAGSRKPGSPPLVITPHPGEMARLAGCSIADVQKDRLNVARKFAREHRLIVVLKGYRTIVTAGDEAGVNGTWINTTGNPGMSTGGTGDILTGMVAGMIAQHPKDVFRAVIAAVYLHGLAGDVARENMGEHSLVATDLLAALPEAFRRAYRDAQQLSFGWHG